MPPAADRRAEMLHVLDLQRAARARQDPHRGVGGQVGAIVGQGQRDGQELLHLVDAAEHQRRELADAVPEAEPRLAHRDLEDLLEQPDLGQLHGDDRRRIVDEGVERRTARAPRPGRPDRPSFLSTSPQTTDAAVEHLPHDRPVDRMLQQLRPSAEVARVVAAERDRPPSLICCCKSSRVTSMLTGSNGAQRDGMLPATRRPAVPVTTPATPRRCPSHPAGQSRKRPSRDLVFVFRMAISSAFARDAVAVVGVGLASSQPIA